MLMHCPNPQYAQGGRRFKSCHRIPFIYLAAAAIPANAALYPVLPTRSLTPCPVTRPKGSPALRIGVPLQ